LYWTVSHHIVLLADAATTAATIATFGFCLTFLVFWSYEKLGTSPKVNVQNIQTAI